MVLPQRRILFTATAATFVVFVTLLTWFINSTVEYAPIKFDPSRRDGLVVDPSPITSEHLDHLETVLNRYGEWYERIDGTHLRISRTLWSDRELLWNYTNKAIYEQSEKR